MCLTILQRCAAKISITLDHIQGPELINQQVFIQIDISLNTMYDSLFVTKFSKLSLILIFIPTALKKYHVLNTNNFVIKTFSKLFVWIMKFESYLSIGSFYWKSSKLNIFKREKSFIMQKQTLEVFCKKRSFKHFAKSTGKHLFWSHLFFNKVAGLQGLTLAQLFSCKIFFFCAVLLFSCLV